jgi:hypothetical protein
MDTRVQICAAFKFTEPWGGTPDIWNMVLNSYVLHVIMQE